MKITIPGTLPNLNDYIKACRGNKYAAASMKNQAEHIIILCAKRAKKFSAPVFIKILWVEPNKKRDKDNIAFAKKFIFDGLIKAGVLQGDGWQYIEGFSDTFRVDKKNPRIEIEIEETNATCRGGTTIK